MLKIIFFNFDNLIFIIKIMKAFLIPLLLLINLTSYSQDYNWWNKKHNWDGITHWSEYIILSPKYMGPNALPVPDHQSGIFDSITTLDVSFDSHFSKGDQTQNSFAKLIIPIIPNKVGISFFGVPFEHYKTDTITRDYRASRDYDSKGFSFGDLYITTYIQLIKDKDKIPDFLVTINLKTASGNSYDAARFTDSPGYYFDLSSGKTFNLKRSFIKSIRPYYTVGFYAWQTNKEYRQNDAFIYGFGCDFNLKKITISNYFGGYIGYIGDGDKPMVNRLILRSAFNSFINYKIIYQQGFLDFNYTTFRFGIEYSFKKNK